MNFESSDFFNGRKVFLTGHTGFKGSWMLYWLNQLGAIVKGYALKPEQENNLYDQINGDDFCISGIADIRDKNIFTNSLISFQPDVIFHFAAQPLVRLSYDLPDDTMEVNSLGTAYLLSALKQLNKKCVVVMITTDKVYENKEWYYPYREVDRLGGLDPYSASKACAEIIINSYTHSFFNLKNIDKHQKAIAVARAGNVIGGGDWAKDRIIPDTIRALQSGQEVVLRNPNSIRPWQHVLEPLGGYLLLAQKLFENPEQFSGPWNFGPYDTDAISVQKVVEKSIQIWGEGGFSIDNSQNNLHEAGLLKLDINKAQKLLNWFPKWDANEAIERTINWYKDYLKGKNPIELLKSDIASYCN
jgi:CDP-glucose 4,6-dehydratase